MRELSLRTAIIISFSLHMLALSPKQGFHFARPHEIKREIEVTYILEDVRETTEMEKRIESVPERYDVEKKKTQVKSEDASPQAAQVEKVTRLDTPQPEVTEHIAIENLEDYISYYELIREAIRAHVDRYYTYPEEEGEVHVIFRVTSRGQLIKASINKVKSVSSDALQRIALQSVHAAAPFPPFPQALDKKELTFTILIIFKKE